MLFYKKILLRFLLLRFGIAGYLPILILNFNSNFLHVICTVWTQDPTCLFFVEGICWNNQNSLCSWMSGHTTNLNIFWPNTLKSVVVGFFCNFSFNNQSSTEVPQYFTSKFYQEDLHMKVGSR